MALDDTNFEKIKPFSALEQTVRANLSEHNVAQGNPVSKVNIDEVRAIAAYIDETMTLFEGGQNLNPEAIYNLREPAMKSANIKAVLRENGGKTVVSKVQKDGVQSLTRLEKAKLKAALKTVENGTSSFVEERQKYEQRVIDSARVKLCQAVADDTVVYKNINIKTDDNACKKLAEAMDKIDPDVLATLQSDPETYNQAIVDIHTITMMHGKPYGFSSKVKAIAAKVQSHVESVKVKELENVVNTAYEEDKERLDVLKSRLEKALVDNPDSNFNDISLGKADLIDVLHFLEDSDPAQSAKLKKDKAGYHQALLEIASVSQSDQKDKVSVIQNVIDERVANPIDKSFLRKSFAAVAGVLFAKPKMAMAKPVLSKVGTSLVGKKSIAAMFGAVMALGASTNTVDQDSGVPAISMADAGVQVSTNFEGFVGNTGYEDPSLSSAIDTFVANSADATTVIAAAATIMDAAGDGKINGETPAGAALVEAGEVDVNQAVMTVDHGLRMAVAEATIQEYSDLEGGEVSVADDANMAYMVQETGVSYSLDGLFGTDGVATERLQAVSEIGSTIAQNALDRLESANATGLTPYLVPEGQTLTHFIESNPELQAFANSSDVLLPSQETTMIAVALKEVNPSITNINQISAGGVYFVPSAERLAELIDITEQPSRELIQDVRNDNRKAGLDM